MHYKYHLTVIHGKSEYSYKGPVISLMRSSNEVTILIVIILLFSTNEVINLQIRTIMRIGFEDAFSKWRDI